MNNRARGIPVLSIAAVATMALANEPTEPPGSTPQRCTPPPSYRLSDVELQMTRTDCLGTCPEYSVILKGDGTGVYEGRKHVIAKGTRKLKVERDQFVELLERVYAIDFFGLADDYATRQRIDVDDQGNVKTKWIEITVVDAPFLILRVRIADCERELRLSEAAPRRFWVFADEVDQAAGVSRWVAKED